MAPCARGYVTLGPAVRPDLQQARWRGVRLCWSLRSTGWPSSTSFSILSGLLSSTAWHGTTQYTNALHCTACTTPDVRAPHWIQTPRHHQDKEGLAWRMSGSQEVRRRSGGQEVRRSGGQEVRRSGGGQAWPVETMEQAGTSVVQFNTYNFKRSNPALK